MMNADQIRSLRPALGTLLERFRPAFPRVCSFRHLGNYVSGLMTDMVRKSIEPIALACHTSVRTLQEFLSHLPWDDYRANTLLQHYVADCHASDRSIGVIDGSAHRKQGRMTPGVQRQWCGEQGKVENCVIGQHLLYCDNDPDNPFTCMLASDLYLPRSWSDDRERCRAAHIPDHIEHQPTWLIALDQVSDAMANGIRFSWMTFDEEYGKVPQFWFGLDGLGQRAVGEVPKNFLCWPTYPSCHSLQGPFAAKKVENACRHSPVFRAQPWRRVHVKNTTHGACVWDVKTARVHLVDTSDGDSRPTDRQYWLTVARNPATGEIKYFVSNAAAGVDLAEMLQAAFARWHIEKWFERAKQEAGLGAFEVRTYCSLIRHWLCARIAMLFLAEQTQRLRGEKSADHAGTSGHSGEPVDHGHVHQMALAIP
jgi:SRSO17 transposase